MSWGPATVFIHERMPDSEVIPGVVDRYATSFRPTISLPIPMPSLNITFSDIDNIDEDSDSLNPVPPLRNDNSSRLEILNNLPIHSYFLSFFLKVLIYI